MQKIMFDDRFDLTQAVIDGRKTQTRRLEAEPRNASFGLDWLNHLMYEDKTRYHYGEKVAIAQSYETVHHECLKNGMARKAEHLLSYRDTPGWKNKMFVKAKEMLYGVKIDVLYPELLQDISDEDCFKEGIQADCKNVQYSFASNIGYCGQYPFDTPREAFAALIDKVSGKGTWEKNPGVIVYNLKVIKL